MSVGLKRYETRKEKSMRIALHSDEGGLNEMIQTREQRRAFGIGEFATMFGISKDAAKRLAKTDVLKTIMLGGRRLVPLSEVLRIEQYGLSLPNGRPRKSPSPQNAETR